MGRSVLCTLKNICIELITSSRSDVGLHKKNTSQTYVITKKTIVTTVYFKTFAIDCHPRQILVVTYILNES